MQHSKIKKRIDKYLLYTRMCDIHLRVPCTRLANVSVGYPMMHKALVVLYVYNSTLWYRP